MSVHTSEAMVDPQGRVVLAHLPLQPGEKVDVIVRSHPGSRPNPGDLKGSVLRYDDPCDPITCNDWESNR